MTDDIKDVAEQQDNEIDYKAFYEANKETLEKLPGLLEKNKELLAEAKRAKDEKRKASDAIENEKKQLAEKNGEYETLWKQTQETLAQKEKELMNERQERRNEKLNIQAIKIANELAKGDAYKAELLSVFVAQSLANVADEQGNMDNDLLASVKVKFETEERFKPLLGGNLSVGGSAQGNAQSVKPDNKQITRKQFDSMPADQRMAHLKAGGKVTD